MNILARHIRKEGLISEGLTIQNQRLLMSITGTAKLCGTQKKSEFERHVETRQTRTGIEFRFRNVVDTERTFADDPTDFLIADFAAIVALPRATRRETRADDSEDDGAKMLLVIIRKRTVYENVALVHLALRASLTAALSSFAVKCFAPAAGL